MCLLNFSIWLIKSSVDKDLLILIFLYFSFIYCILRYLVIMMLTYFFLTSIPLFDILSHLSLSSTLSLPPYLSPPPTHTHTPFSYLFALSPPSVPLSLPLSHCTLHLSTISPTTLFLLQGTV